MAAEMDAMVEAVQKYARNHYGEDGWDVVVECYSRPDIVEVILDAGARTPTQAVKAMREICTAWDDRRKDIEATAF